MSERSPQAVVRTQARKALRHNYARAVVALIAVLVPVLMLDTAAALIVNCFLLFTSGTYELNILCITVINPVILTAGVLLSPFINGYIRVYYRNALTGRMDLNDLYYYFESGRYSRALHLNLSLLLRLFLPAILFFFPVVLYEAVSIQIGGGFYGGVLYRDVFFLLTVLSVVILTLYALKYYTVYTLSIENEDLEINELFRASKRIMYDRTGDAARLIFSYTPWMLLCLTVLPILYVAPYMTQGLCIGAQWMTRAANEEET